VFLHSLQEDVHVNLGGGFSLEDVGVERLDDVKELVCTHAVRKFAYKHAAFDPLRVVDCVDLSHQRFDGHGHVLELALGIRERFRHNGESVCEFVVGV